ncbi:MAG: hypothetical protein ACFFBD_03630, partial [Candidatus Hodarchaeota archaeon]
MEKVLLSFEETRLKKVIDEQITTKNITFNEIKDHLELLKRPITQKELIQYLTFQQEKGQTGEGLYLFGYKHNSQDQ